MDNKFTIKISQIKQESSQEDESIQMLLEGDKPIMCSLQNDIGIPRGYRNNNASLPTINTGTNEENIFEPNYDYIDSQQTLIPMRQRDSVKLRNNNMKRFSEKSHSPPRQEEIHAVKHAFKQSALLRHEERKKQKDKRRMKGKRDASTITEPSDEISQSQQAFDSIVMKNNQRMLNSKTEKLSSNQRTSHLMIGSLDGAPKVRDRRQSTMLRGKFQNKLHNCILKNALEEESPIKLNNNRQSWAQKEAEQKYILSNIKIEIKSEEIIKKVITNKFQNLLKDIQKIEENNDEGLWEKNNTTESPSDSNDGFLPSHSTKVSMRVIKQTAPRNQNEQACDSKISKEVKINAKPNKSQSFQSQIFIDINNEDKEEAQLVNNKRLGHIKWYFTNLIKQTFVYTKNDIVSVILSHDQKLAIVLLFAQKELFFIRMYNLNTTEYNEIRIKGTYINAKEIEQRDDSLMFCLPFLNKGLFFILIFSQNKILEQVDVNTLLGIDDSTVPNENVQEPLINCCFKDDDTLFVNLYHPKTMANWHFLYSIKDSRLVCHAYSNVIGSEDSLNFPIKTFFNHYKNEACVFYRQGQMYTIKLDQPEKLIFQQLTKSCLTQLSLTLSKVIIAQTSLEVQFFREEDEIEFGRDRKKWQLYHRIEQAGFIFFDSEKTKLTMTNEKEIKFYKIDPVTYLPTLYRMLSNFDDCSSMISSSSLEYCITYKMGQIGFHIYRRKYKHSFMAKLQEKSYNNSLITSLNNIGQYMVSEKDEIQVYCQRKFELHQVLQLDLTREDGESLQILSVRPNFQQSLLGVMVGKNSRETGIEVMKIFILQRNLDGFWAQMCYCDMPESLYRVCTQFYFRNRMPNEILLAQCIQIVSFNFRSSETTLIYSFEEYLNGQPIHCVFNTKQTIAMVSTQYDVLQIDLRERQEYDIDNEYQLGDIKCLEYLFGNFYMVASKFRGQIGNFFLVFNERKMTSQQEPEEHFQCLLKKKSRQDISDAQIFMTNKSNMEGQQIVFCCKVNHMNKYIVYVFKLDTGKLQMIHESDHLWEAKVQSILIKCNDLFIFSNEGMKIICLGDNYQKLITSPNIQDQMLHPLSSCFDFKLENSNIIKYQYHQDIIIITIQERTRDTQGFHHFTDVYKVKIGTVLLPQLLLFKSIFFCTQRTEMVQLIQDQPDIQIFHKSFLELGRRNMVQILAFEGNAVKILLEAKDQTFNKQFPIFYKVKCFQQQIMNHADLFNQNKYKIKKSSHQKSKDEIQGQLTESAIDVAMDNNQIVAIKIMIHHVVTYQNNPVSSFLFREILIQLMQKGIEVSELLNSNIFSFAIEISDWPNVHFDNTELTVPYNSTIFCLKDHYNSLFGKKLDSGNEDHERSAFLNLHEIKKIYKIKYVFNILPSIADYEDTTFNEACGATRELEIFKCKCVIDLLKYKWFAYAKKIHNLSLFCHTMYLFSFTAFINQIYAYNHPEISRLVFWSMILCLVYPCVYDTTQLVKQGYGEYLLDPWNWSDQMHIWGGFLNTFLHSGKIDRTDRKMDLARKVIIMFLIFLMLLKTFFFMRLFPSMAHLVKMMSQVMTDLKAFLGFFLILVWITSLVFTTIELGNYEGSLDPAIRAKMVSLVGYPGKEYMYLPKFVQQMFNVLRIAFGDFDFGQSMDLNEFENILYWITWLVLVILTCIIFLNFIIAEVSSSYDSVKSKIEGYIQQDRAQLIKESEDMLAVKDKKDIIKFPSYIVSREVEDNN